VFRRRPTEEHVESIYEIATKDDIYWMGRAIEFAQGAREFDHLPFGCVIVRGCGECLAVRWGTGTINPVEHSEIEAIRVACQHHDHGIYAPQWLKGCTLYSTHQPCVMCCGAINHAKISRVVFGSYRQDLPHLFRDGILSKTLLANTSHPPEVLGGVLRQECIDLFAGVEKWD